MLRALHPVCAAPHICVRQTQMPSTTSAPDATHLPTTPRATPTDTMHRPASNPSHTDCTPHTFTQPRIDPADHVLFLASARSRDLSTTHVPIAMILPHTQIIASTMAKPRSCSQTRTVSVATCRARCWRYTPQHTYSITRHTCRAAHMLQPSPTCPRHPGRLL